MTLDPICTICKNYLKMNLTPNVRIETVELVGKNQEKILVTVG